VVGGEYKVAQYGQWDGYPSGQGSTILGFLSGKLNRDEFLANLEKVFEPTEDQIAEWWLEVGHDIKTGNGFVDCRISDAYGEKHPSLSRDTAGEILDLIQSSQDPVPVKLRTGFAGDSLFCEVAYVIDFDKNTFEVFKGFNKKPLGADDRFSFLQGEEKSNGYTPVKLLHSFDLLQLPTEEEFLAVCEPRDEDEE